MLLGGSGVRESFTSTEALQQGLAEARGRQQVVVDLTTDAQSNPIKDALNWCLGEPFAADFMWVDHDVVYVRVENFVAYVKKSGTYTLPGNHKAVRRFLHEQLHGEDVRTRMKMTDQQVRAVKIPVVALGQDK